jgi:hypothetical protein
VLLPQVTKSDEYPWSVLKPDVFAGIMDHYTSGAETLQAGASPKNVACSNLSFLVKT